MTAPGAVGSDAAREARPAPPPCEAQPPLCGICGNDTWHDGDGWTCDVCMASWPTEAQSQRAAGEWDNPTAAVCESVDGRYLPGGTWWSTHEAERFASQGIPVIRRCMLHEEHSGDHTWTDEVIGRYCWTDTTAATTEQLAADHTSVSRPAESDEGHRRQFPCVVCGLYGHRPDLWQGRRAHAYKAPS